MEMPPDPHIRDDHAESRQHCLKPTSVSSKITVFSATDEPNLMLADTRRAACFSLTWELANDMQTRLSAALQA